MIFMQVPQSQKKQLLFIDKIFKTQLQNIHIIYVFMNLIQE